MFLQEDVKLEYQGTEKSGTGKRKTLAVYSKPYFKDSCGSVSVTQQIIYAFMIAFITCAYFAFNLGHRKSCYQLS